MSETKRDTGDNALASLATESVFQLNDRLDNLWERYLDALDAYQTAQKQLQSHLASGFFSLAQANYKSSSRRPYGRDYYDERTKASRRCHVQHSDDGSLTVVLQSSAASFRRTKQTSGSTSDSKADVEVTQQPSPPTTPAADAEDPNDEKNGAQHLNAEAIDAEPDQPLAKDPLQWFGILVPRELRTAQHDFRSALDDDSVVAATNASRQMRHFEVEIRKLRKVIRKAEKQEIVSTK